MVTGGMPILLTLLLSLGNDPSAKLKSKTIQLSENAHDSPTNFETSLVAQTDAKGERTQMDPTLFLIMDNYKKWYRTKERVEAYFNRFVGLERNNLNFNFQVPSKKDRTFTHCFEVCNFCRKEMPSYIHALCEQECRNPRDIVKENYYLCADRLPSVIP
ncbi:unnamed protein product [Owenia fusiformis]|uniref:Uncharacterized protein n=1 Tax=Owenia fusiformis TaxID=6347 RepID=A0A8S4N3U9_OWEFU|nr:unnamed protein product [Owenia fusiformis]